MNILFPTKISRYSLELLQGHLLFQINFPTCHILYFKKKIDRKSESRNLWSCSWHLLAKSTNIFDLKSTPAAVAAACLMWLKHGVREGCSSQSPCRGRKSSQQIINNRKYSSQSPCRGRKAHLFAAKCTVPEAFPQNHFRYKIYDRKYSSQSMKDMQNTIAGARRKCAQICANCFDAAFTLWKHVETKLRLQNAIGETHMTCARPAWMQQFQCWKQPYKCKTRQNQRAGWKQSCCCKTQ